MKTRFRNYYDLANAWVDAVKDGKNVKLSMYGDRMYSNGNKIFSYGDHYCIANVVETANGRVVLFNSETYSSTTSKHKNAVQYAARNLIAKRFDVPITYLRYGNLTAEHHYSNLKWFKEMESIYINKAAKARSRKQSYIEDAAYFAAKAEEYAKYFPEAIAYRLIGRVA
jgi:hypothetical protein